MTTDPAAKPAARRSPRTKAVAEPPPAPPSALFTAHLTVRWRDLDAFNHVNNANYLTFLEEARLQWLQQVRGEWFGEGSMPVLASSEVNYRRPIAWPAQLAIELGCERIGNSSLTIAHRIVDVGDPERLYSDGRVVLVWMNPATGKPVPLPQAIRDAIG